jgi:hypothetical protein
MLLSVLSLQMAESSCSSSTSSPPTTASTSVSKKRVAIIGGGSGGLVAARELLGEGHDVVIFESRHDIGGQWFYQQLDDIELQLNNSITIGKGTTSTTSSIVDQRHALARKVDAAYNASMQSSIYPRLRTNLSRAQMQFSDYPFPSHTTNGTPIEDYPSASVVWSYLNQFARHYHVYERVRLGHRVEWVSIIDRSDSSFINSNKATIVDTTPSHIVGDKRFNVYFSKLTTTTVPTPVAETKDTVTSPAAVTEAKTDIGNDGSDNKSTTMINTLYMERFDAVVVANGHFTLPYIPPIDGLATTRCATRHAHSYRTPYPFIGQRVLVIGAAYSGADIATQIASVSIDGNGISAINGTNRVHLSVRGRRIVPPGQSATAILPGVDCVGVVRRFIEGTTQIEFMDGTIESYDSVIFATGYQYTFPFLSPSVVSKPIERAVDDLFLQVFHADFPTADLSFIGIPFGTVPFPLMELQGHLVAILL